MSGPIRPTDVQLYLARVASQLRLAPGVEREVVEELAAHVVDTTAALVDEGLPVEQAEREALARLGSPEALADNIRRAQLTSRRLATAGLRAIFWFGWTGLFWMIASFLLLFAATLALWEGLQLLQSASPGVRLPLGSFVGFGPFAIAFDVGAFFGAREAVLVASRGSRRSVAQVGRWAAVLGTPVVAILAIAIFEGDLDLLAVIALLLVPPAFVVGCLAGPRLRWPAHPLRWAAAIAGGCMLVVALGALGAPQSQTFGTPPVSEDMGFQRVAGQLAPGSEPVFEYAMVNGTASGTQGLGFSWSPASAAGAWHDLRLEAWRGAAAGSQGIAPGATAPFATAVPRDVAGTLQASIRVDGRPGVTHYWLALTGADATGQRWILGPPYSGWTTYHGSVATWLAAIFAPAP
jgi:HAAS